MAIFGNRSDALKTYLLPWIRNPVLADARQSIIDY